MDIRQKKTGDLVEFDLLGRLDANTAPEAEKTISSAIDGGASKLLFNLDSLEYISSAGLRVMLVAAKKIRQTNGKIVLCSLKDNVQEVFDISGFSSIFNIADTAEDALNDLAQ